MPPRFPDPTQLQFQQAMTLHQQGRFADAEPIYQRILAANPTHFDALHMLGIMACQTGQIEKGVQFLSKAASINPHIAALHSNLGNAQLILRRFADALASCDKAIALDPTSPEAWNNRAIALQELGRLDDALASCDKAIALRPNYATAFNIRGLILKELHRYEDAIATYDKAVAANPDFATAHYNRGNLLLQLNRLEEAVSSFDRAIRLQADFAEAHNGRAVALLQLLQVQEAMESCRKAIAAKPDFADAYVNLGNIFAKLDLLDEAQKSYAQALAINPTLMEAQNNTSLILRRFGLIEDAVAVQNRALTDTPNNMEGHRNLLLTLTYHPTLDIETYFAEHRRFEDRFARPLYAEQRPHANIADPDRRLRIGYLSSDMRNHTVARSMLPILRHRARGDFEIYFYAEVARPDDVTGEVRALADGWRSTVGLSDREVADRVRTDGIDILVCLAGRFDKNRPLVCAYKPAPIQIGFHDVATSGLSSIDYLFSDRVLTPRNTAEQFTERLLCLPHFYLGQIPQDAPPIRPRKQGPIVFGCLNNPAKISSEVLDLWGRILSRIPDSRLLLRYFGAYDAATLRERIHAGLDRHGIEQRRVIFPDAEESHGKSLDQYNAVDIALDTFPFSGSTTTFDALVMGVPVVTLPGQTMVSRWSASMLTSLGMPDLIAHRPQDYVDIACALAADADKRAMLRRTLRERVTRSPLCDHAGRTRQIERYYRAVWRRWCATAATASA